MHDTWKELERACERATKELCELNDRLDQNKNVLSPVDLDNLTKTVETIKNSKSAMKKIIEMDEMMDENQNGYSGNYYSQPMWDRRYSGNSYRGTYTVATGDGHDGYSGRGMSRRYSRDTERDNMRAELDDMLRDSRDERESEIIKRLMNRL